MKILKTIRERPYSLLFWPLSGLYLVLILGSYLYMYDGQLNVFYTSFPAWYTITTTLLTFIISLLGGTVMTLFIAKLHEFRAGSAGVGILGMLVGSLSAGCPGCFFGLFPFLLSLFGITGTLALLPLKGIELQLITVLLLIVSIVLLERDAGVSCKVA